MTVRGQFVLRLKYFLTSLRVTAVLSGVDTPEVKLRADDLPLARLRPTEDWRLVISCWAVHPAVTAVPNITTVRSGELR